MLPTIVGLAAIAIALFVMPLIGRATGVVFGNRDFWEDGTFSSLLNGATVVGLVGAAIFLVIFLVAPIASRIGEAILQ